MHIGFDISQTGSGKAGCGFFAHAMAGELLRACPGDRFGLYPSFGDFYFDPLMPVMNPYRGGEAKYGPRVLTREAARAFWNAPDLEARLGHPELVHANNFWCPAQPLAARLVYTCYDLGFMVDPSWTTEANRVGCFEGMFRAAAMADWVVAISAHTAGDFARTFPHFPAGRLRVIHPASRFEAPPADARPPAAARALVPGGFFLTVGTIEPRKNQRLLARAYAAYAKQVAAPLPLVFAGGRGWLMDDFQRELAALGIERWVTMTGYVQDAELAWLYANCRANFYPSRFEGFGLPVLEAMQLGAACAVSDSSSLPEVAGEAAILVPPDDEAGWTRALRDLATDDALRARLAEAGGRQARRFRATDSARALRELYAEAVASPKRTP